MAQSTSRFTNRECWNCLSLTLTTHDLALVTAFARPCVFLVWSPLHNRESHSHEWKARDILASTPKAYHYQHCQQRIVLVAQTCIRWPT